MNNTEIILPSDPRSAKCVNSELNLWLARTGELSLGEQTARRIGATHFPCEICGKPALKPDRFCSIHQEKYEEEKYLQREVKEWDEISPLYSDAFDKYYSGIEHCLDDLEDGQSLLDLRLLICEETHYTKLVEDHWYDEVPEDEEMPLELVNAIEEFNKRIEGLSSGYYPSRYRVDTTAWEQ